MRCRTPEARCLPARCPSGSRLNQNPANTIGIPRSPAANTEVICSLLTIHHTRAIAKTSGTHPPTKLMKTIRWPHVPRLRPTRPTVNQKNPQAALSTSPPVMNPAQLSINTFVTTWPLLPCKFQEYLFQIGLPESVDDFLRRSLRHDTSALKENDAIRHFFHLAHIM